MHPLKIGFNNFCFMSSTLFKSCSLFFCSCLLALFLVLTKSNASKSIAIYSSLSIFSFL
uniref:Uncharacterized protein n=1 Tax=uncultured marine virus TaxID=186617 RepID=A0A0F7L7F3_9VIRU|nr:hypothetical protein [uncultured marine virus]